jgi:hypothetical protein
MTDKPAPDDPRRRAADEPADEVEGHSLALIMGIGALDRAGKSDRSRQKVKDSELPPLAKPFPSMKDEPRK